MTEHMQYKPWNRMSMANFLKQYSIIYADPPWDYEGRKQHNGKADTGGAIEHYSTMTLSDLKLLPVEQLAAKDALLFMWVTNPHLPQGLELMNSWGFEYSTVAFVWDKKKTNPGYYTLSQVELCIVGKRGRIPKPRGARNVRQFISAERGAHSAKPDEVRDRIALMFPEVKKIELFARGYYLGWDAWGDQLPNQGEKD